MGALLSGGGSGSGAEDAAEEGADLAGDLVEGALAALEGAAEPQGGQAVHDRPGQVGDGLGIASGRPALGLDLADAAQQQLEGGVAGRRELRVILVEQVALPHHREVGRVGEGEAGVGPAGRAEPLAGGGLRAELAGTVLDGPGEQAEALDGDGGEQGRLVGEVVGRRGVGDAEPPGQRAQADRRRPLLGDQLQGRVQQVAAQVAAVVGRVGPPARPSLRLLG